jgi:hypothetical protein
LSRLVEKIGGVVSAMVAVRDIIDGLYRALPGPGRHSGLQESA